jgi:hypothetical protein
MPVLVIGILMLIILPVIVFKVMRGRAINLERERYIRRYTFSADIFSKIQDKYPFLEEKDIFLVAKGLREYFIIYLRSGSQIVGMPSKVVDEMWHEFILDTRKYTEFCHAAFGCYFHHIPASKSEKGVPIENAMKLTWRLACLEENINPIRATRLPLLFAIDAKLNIPDGNVHVLSPIAAKTAGATTNCGGIACAGSSCSDASGCGGGDGGGCGGGD